MKNLYNKKRYNKPKIISLDELARSFGGTCTAGRGPGGTCSPGGVPGTTCSGGTLTSSCGGGTLANGGGCNDGTAPIS